MTKKILLFDIDGTLLLTGGVGIIAFEKAFHDLFGTRNAWGDMIPDGKTDPFIIEEISQKVLNRSLKETEYAKLSEKYLFYFRDEIKRAPNFRLMPGVLPLLQTLSEKEDTLLGIATGNLEEAGWLKLERGRIRSFFSFGGFGSDSIERSEILKIAIKRGEKILGRAVAREKIYVIGDTHHDVRAGKKLGVKTIGVATGSLKEKYFLGDHEPDCLLQDLSDTQSFLKLIR